MCFFYPLILENSVYIADVEWCFLRWLLSSCQLNALWIEPDWCRHHPSADGSASPALQAINGGSHAWEGDQQDWQVVESLIVT